ncbi:hypothetical protein BJX99DRAFT_181507 [Aspergillus californicus]
MKVLITGAGIAGTSLAFFLSKLGHSITVLERAPSLRTSGLQIDLRGSGIKVLRRMGLEPAFKTKSIAEQGLRIVDKRGSTWGYFPANRSGRGKQSFSTDYEIMRGDLCEMLYRACLERGGVEFVFGGFVRAVNQQEHGVDVEFSNGTSGVFDLVVGADGLGSRMRKMMMGFDESDDANPGFHPLGVYAGYCTIPLEMRAGEGYDATAFIATGNRGIMTRRNDPKRYQAYVLCKAAASERLKTTSKGDIDEEKYALSSVLRGAGWESEAILDGLVKADDFYCERMGVVKLDSWYRGRIALLGDAGYCPSAMTGMGTTSAMVGAYVLAGEIGKACGNGAGPVAKEDLTTALKAYDGTFRPFMDEVQKGLTDTDDYLGKFPSSAFSITMLYCLVWLTSCLRLDIIAAWVLREDDSRKGWTLPDYPEIDG